MSKEQPLRRRFDKEFKMQAVKMVLEDHLPVNEVARRLNVGETLIRLQSSPGFSPGMNAARSEASVAGVAEAYMA